MTLPNATRDRFDALLAGFIEGSLTEDEKNEFGQALANAEARQLYYEHVAVHGMLSSEHGTTPIKTNQISRLAKSQSRPRLRILPYAAAAVLLLSVGLIAIYNRVNPPVAPLQPAQFASLIMTRNAVWSDNDASRVIGSRLGSGTLQLKSGTAAIVFDNGTQLVFSGPATIGIDQPTEVTLQRGNALINAPAGTHFEIRSNVTRSRYRDGQFGVVLAEDGAGETHALAGQVELQTPNLVLAAGSSVAYNARGEAGPIGSADARKFSEALALLKTMAQAVKTAPTPTAGVLIGWDFRETLWYLPGGDATVTPTQNRGANASHDVPGVSGTFFHLRSGFDSGGHDGNWTTSIMNSTDRFAFITLNVTVPTVTLSGIRLSAVENDPTDYMVSVEISPRNATGPVGEGFTVLGTFTATNAGGDFAPFSGALSLSAGTYYIRFRPTTTPVVTTSWMTFDNVVLLGTAAYVTPAKETDF